MGVGAYDIAWIGAHCVAGVDGVGRYRWIKDNTLVAAGYTNFDRDIFPSSTKQQGNDAFCMGTKFISTGAYSAGAVDDVTNFHAIEEGRGAASL
jgi:hypothetical protein